MQGKPEPTNLVARTQPPHSISVVTVDASEKWVQVGAIKEGCQNVIVQVRAVSAAVAKAESQDLHLSSEVWPL